MEALTLESEQIKRIMKGFLTFRDENYDPILNVNDFSEKAGFVLDIETPSSVGDVDNVRTATEDCYGELEELHCWFKLKPLENKITLTQFENRKEHYFILITGMVEQTNDPEGTPGMFIQQILFRRRKSGQLLILKYKVYMRWPAHAFLDSGEQDPNISVER